MSDDVNLNLYCLRRCREGLFLFLLKIKDLPFLMEQRFAFFKRVLI
jgi:hypothetical protein